MIKENELEEIEYIRSLFRDSYNDAYKYLKRASLIQKAFDCEIDEEDWTTVSELYFPILRSAVMYVIPYVFQYLFPKDSFIELIPEADAMPFQTVTRIEQFLEDLLIWKMAIRKDGLLTVQDALKFGCGYGVVEKKVITPPAVRGATAIAKGSKVGSHTIMTTGEPKEVVSYRYIPYQTIIPTQDGDNPDDVSCVFHVDFIRTDVLKQMYEMDSAKPEEERVFMASAEQIIEDTLSRKTDGSMYQLWWIMANLADNKDILSKMRNHNEIVIRASTDNIQGPVQIPVLKCYFKDYHIWLANGETIIYKEENSYQTLRCPIIKATATPDAGNWYANSDVSAAQDIAEGVVIYKNSILDLLTSWLHPPVIWNQDMLPNPNQAPDTGPFGNIPVYATDNYEKAVGYLQGPPIPEAIAGFGTVMESDLAHHTGRSLAIETNQLGGLTRAGSGATESLLQNMSARQELVAAVLQMNWLESVVLNALAQLQTMEGPLSTTVRDNEKKEFRKLAVSQEEIRNVFGARINFGGENKSVNDKVVDIQLYQLMIRGNPFFNQVAPVEDIIGAKKANRWKASEEEIQKNLAIMQQQTQQSQGLTRGQQAVAGGSAQRSAR